MADNEAVMTIGHLAKAAGTSTPTIRYYEEIGLLPVPRRTASGQRVYRTVDLTRLTFIRRCRDFGFSIDEIRRLAALEVSPDEDCTEVRDIAAGQLARIEAQLDELSRLAGQMRDFVSICDAACCGGPGKDCVALAELRDQPGDR